MRALLFRIRPQELACPVGISNKCKSSRIFSELPFVSCPPNSRLIFRFPLEGERMATVTCEPRPDGEVEVGLSLEPRLEVWLRGRQSIIRSCLKLKLSLNPFRLRDLVDGVEGGC
jgi:hypothetical protein